MDPYRILGITNRRVPHAELRAAYLKLAKQWHPDGHPTHKQAHATHQFKLISQAWDAIGTPSKRRVWDAQHYYGRNDSTSYRTSTSRRTTTYDHYQQQQQQQQQQQYYAEYDIHMKTYSTKEKIWFVVVLMVGTIGWWWWDRMKTAKAGVDVLVPAFFNRTTGQWQRAPPEMFNSRDPFIISLIEYKPIHTLVGSDATTAPITRVIPSPSTPPGVRAYQLPFATKTSEEYTTKTTSTSAPTSTPDTSSSTTTTPQTANQATSKSNKTSVMSDPFPATTSTQQISVTSSNTSSSAPTTTSIQELITSTPDPSSPTPTSTATSFASIHPIDVIPMNASHLQHESLTSNTHDKHTNHPQSLSSQTFMQHDISTSSIPSDGAIST